MAPISVIGAGGWGTALAIHLAAQGHAVALWCAFEDLALRLNEKRENTQFLPGVSIPYGVKITASAPDAADAELLVFAVPTPYIRETMVRIGRELPQGRIMVSVSKGIEVESLLRPSQILEEFFADQRPVVLSGPSHAEEVARKLPTSVVVACRDRRQATRVQRIFSSPLFRVYSSGDVTGVELCGALKNVIGIASGISDGLGFGDNSKAALLTRGLAEIARLGVALGAREETFRGLAGMGDLITTCVSGFGRNHALGFMIGQGKTLQEAKGAMGGMVAEGVLTSCSALKLAQAHSIEMPITHEVYRILFEGKDPKTAVTDLMCRELKSESG